MIHRSLSHNQTVYLSCNVVDMRKSINGLAAIVQGTFQLDPYEGALFVFCNSRKDKIKILQWDKDGFALYYKRRERGRFFFPDTLPAESNVGITKADLYRLLDGLVMEQFVPHRNYSLL